MNAQIRGAARAVGAGWETVRPGSFDGHRKTLPFLPLFGNASMADSAETLNSSLVVWVGNLTFRVIGGKSGKMMAKTATIAAR
jgi:hypothetical protein